MVQLDLDSLTVDANCREVVDNVVDMAHFFEIHYAFGKHPRERGKLALCE